MQSYRVICNFFKWLVTFFKPSMVAILFNAALGDVHAAVGLDVWKSGLRDKLSNLLSGRVFVFLLCRKKNLHLRHLLWYPGIPKNSEVPVRSHTGGIAQTAGTIKAIITCKKIHKKKEWEEDVLENSLRTALCERSHTSGPRGSERGGLAQAWVKCAANSSFAWLSIMRKGKLAASHVRSHLRLASFAVWSDFPPPPPPPPPTPPPPPPENERGEEFGESGQLSTELRCFEHGFLPQAHPLSAINWPGELAGKWKWKWKWKHCNPGAWLVASPFLLLLCAQLQLLMERLPYRQTLRKCNRCVSSDARCWQAGIVKCVLRIRID